MRDEARLRALLNWHLLAGADEAVDEAPRDRYRDSAPRPKPPPPATEAPKPAAKPAATPAAAPAPPPAAGDAVWSAQEIAAGCEDLEALKAAICAFEGCALKRTASNTVIADGDPQAALVFVGEAPGAEEDRQGLPFVGPAGRLLDRMLAAIGLERQAVYITNMLPWRPPGNRSPTAEELAICQPFLERQLELVMPDVLVLLGGISAKALLNRREGITRLRGKWFPYSTPRMAQPVDSMATFHPAYLLRQPSAKREVWRDLLEIEARIGGGPGAP